MAKQSSVERLRLVAQLNADTAKSLQADNSRLRVELAGCEARLAEIARLATVPPRIDEPDAIPLDAVYTLTLGLVSKHSRRLRKITSDSHTGVRLRGAIDATASSITYMRELALGNEALEQQALDVLDAIIAEIVATIPD